MSTRLLLNVVDVEATCWQDNPPSGQRSEIIEIGLTVVDPATELVPGFAPAMRAGARK